MDIEITFINQSYDENNTDVVIFSKNVATDFEETAVAWRVIENCGRNWSHKFTYPMHFYVAAQDSRGNVSDLYLAQNGQRWEVVRSPSGDTMVLDSRPAADPTQVEIENALTTGAIDAQIYKAGKLFATKTGVSPQQTAVFGFNPTIWVGAVSQLEEGDVMNAAILSEITAEISLLGITKANLIMTGGGVGPSATPVHVYVGTHGITEAHAMTKAMDAGTEPLVSCVMPTSNRAEFIKQALCYFREQRYGNKELLIVYDRPSDLPADLVLPPRVRLICSTERSIGSKRNEGCLYAQGDFIAQWDDDDIYHPDRLGRQMAPLLAGEADITALQDILFWDQDTNRYWSCTPELFAALFVEQVSGGTLVYRKTLWENATRYPAISLREDAEFLLEVIRKGARLARVPGRNLFIYRRHIRNTWRFTVGIDPYPSGWKQETLPHWASEYPIHIPADTAAPLVSCIMPTHNRPEFMLQAVYGFLTQTYANKELVILDDGTEPIAHLVPRHQALRYVRQETRTVIGAKRNTACRLSRGQIIIHWDDDDWYAPDWIRTQVNCLQQTGAAVCGLNRILFYAPHLPQAWRYEYPGNARPWVAGATMAYRKEFWESHPFEEMQVGEDNRFVWGTEAKVVAHDYLYGFVSFIHAKNTSPKNVELAYWKKFPVDQIRQILTAQMASL